MERKVQHYKEKYERLEKFGYWADLKVGQEYGKGAEINDVSH